MHFKKWLTGLGMLLITSATQGQTGITVTDQQPAVVNGLEMGYRIKSEETKQVSDKGDFSRFSLSFYIRNVSPDEKMILYKPGWGGSLSASDQLAQFNCINATGARLTSKSVTLNAHPCMVMAQTTEKDCASGKTTDVKKLVQIGYSIKPGEVIEASTIMIVPLNEKPNMQAVFLASQMQPMSNGYAATNNNAPAEDNPVRLKNVLTGTYLNTQNIIPASTAIQPDWFSAQWQLIPVSNSGTDYYILRNRSKQSYLAADQGRLVLFSDQNATNCLWILMPTTETDVVRFKNGRSGAYISVTGGQLGLSPAQASDPSTYWIVQH